MTYAFIIDGLDDDKRAEIDILLEGKGSSPTQAKRERAAADTALRFMS